MEQHQAHRQRGHQNEFVDINLRATDNDQGATDNPDNDADNATDNADNVTDNVTDNTDNVTDNAGSVRRTSIYAGRLHPLGSRVFGAQSWPA